MKKSLERDFDPVMDERERTLVNTLTIEALEPRARRFRNVIFAAVIAIVVAVIGVGAVSRAAGLGSPAVTPAPPPTPITWSSAVRPAPAITPVPSRAPGDPTPVPHIRRQLTVQAVTNGAAWGKANGNHFTLSLTNTSGLELPMDPCPAYRMYITGTDVTAAPLHVLNCSAIGPVLAMGASVKLDMVYVASADDPTGAQTLVWTWVLPDDFQATSLINIYLAP